MKSCVSKAVFLFVSLRRQRAGAWTSPLSVRRRCPRGHGSYPTQCLSHASLLSVAECLELYHNSTRSGERSIRFVDGSWYHKGNRNGLFEFLNGPRLPDSVYMDMDDISCQTDLFPTLNPSDLYLMQPPRALLSAWMDFYKIRRTDQVIVYGRSGSVFLPRTWFTLHAVLSHVRVSIMQGSLEDWMRAGGPLDEGVLEQSSSVVRAADLDWEQPTRYDSNSQSPSEQAVVSIVDANYMLSVIGDNKCSTKILDARGSSFAAGHMPGAVHIPYSSLLVDPTSGSQYKPAEEMRKIFLAQGVDPTANTPLVCSCGSGVSACSLYLALHVCGRSPEQSTKVYDGSWNEWKTLPYTPKEQVPKK
jgi:thiosulfate/3-mercaptopyruvate sulfurtransferase